MRTWTIILYTIIIIYQNHVYYTAPVGKSGSAIKGQLKTKFGKIADRIVNPQWTLTDPDSKKKENGVVPSDDTVNENDENQTQPNTQNNDNKRKPKKNNKRRRKKSNNKTKQNNIRGNGRHRWYKMVTVDYLLGNLPEYRNHENEQNIVLIWGDGDERKIELNEHVDALSMKNFKNSQLIRKKRDYNNTFQLQNKLQTKNVKWEDLKDNDKDKLNIEANANNHSQEVEKPRRKLENVKKKEIYSTLEKSRGPNSFDKELSLIDNLEDDENSMNSKSIENSNEKLKFLDLKNTNKNKFHHFVNNKKHPTNTFRNKLRPLNHAQQLGKTSGKNYSETERSPLKTVKQKPKSLKNIPTTSKYKTEFTTKGNADTTTNIPELNEIDSMLDEMNSNTNEHLDSQNIELYPSSLETKLEIPNYSDIEDNKETDILNNIRHSVKSKSKKKGKQQLDESKKLKNKNQQKLGRPLASNIINEKGLNQKAIKQNSPDKKDILIISYDEPELTTNVNSDTAEKIDESDKIHTILNEINSNSDEKLDGQNNGSYPSSLETKQEIPDYSDIEDIKENDILNNIKHPLKPKSKKLGKNQSDDNNKQPKIKKHKLTPTLESNNKNEKGSPQNSIKPLAPNSKEILKISNSVPNLTTGGNDDNVTNTPEPDDIDTIMDELNSNSDENLDDQSNGSYPSSLETKQEIPDYSDIEDIKENDILNNTKHPLKPKSKKLGKKRSDDNNKQPKIKKQKLAPPLESNNNNEKGSTQNSIKPLAPNSKEILKISNSVPNLTTGGNDDNVTNTPEPDDIDTIMDGLNSNSDENLEDQSNGSYPSSLETKQEIPDYSDIEDIKENDILNNIKHPLKPKSKKLGKKRSDDNNKQPKIKKQKLAPPLESNNNNEKASPQDSIKPLAPNSKEILKMSNSVPNLATGGNDDNVTNTPVPDDIDTIMDGLNSNSDENLEDQSNGSYPSSLETKQEIPDYSDIEDIKENDILNNIKHPLKPKSKKLGKKRSDDNNKQPKIKKQKLAPPLESNNNNEKASPQDSIKPLAPNSKEILKMSNSVPNLATGGNDDNVTNTPVPDDIDTIMDELNSNSAENLDEQNNGSYPSSLETKQEIPDYSDIEDIKENDILNNIKHPLKPKSKKLGKKRSDDNNKQPKIKKQKLAPPLESNNNNEKGSPQNSIKPLAPNSKEILKISNSVPNLTTGGNDDNVTNTPERDDIDTIMDGLNSNSDENLDDQNNGSDPSSLETKQEIPDYSDIEDIKENDILNNIKHPLKPKSKKLGKKRSDDNNKQPKIKKQKLAPPLESNNNNEKASPQDSIKPLAPNSKEILKMSNSVPNLTTGGNDDNVTNTPVPDDIDTIMDELNSNSDENLDEQNNGSYPSSLETKQEIPDYSDIEDIKENDILNNIKHPLKPKSKKLGKKRSDDNNKQPKIKKQKLAPPLESNNNNEKGSPQNSIKPLAPNSKEILKVSNSVPNLTTGGNDDNVTNTPEPEDIDTIMDGLNSNSDDNLDGQNNGSYPSSVDSKQEIPDYSDIEDIKEKDILNDLKDPFNPKTKKLGKKRSDNNKQPKIIKHELTTPLESNTNNEKGSPQNSIKPLAPNSKEILKVSNSVPNLTTGGNDDNVTNTPEPEDIDTIMDGLNSNSDDNLDDQNNGSYPSSVDTKQEIPDYSDIEDIKENDILNDLKDPLNPKTKKLGKKRSDNNKQPKIIKHELTTPLESNTNNEKGSPQNSIKPLAPNSKEILKVSNSVPNLTTGGNDDNVTNTPVPDDIDTIMDGLNSNSDENLDDQNNGSDPSSLETKQEIPDYSDIEDIKENHILNDLKDPLNPKTKKLGKKRSDNNKQPKIIKHELTTPLESNTNNEKGSPQNSIKPLAPNSKEILKVSNSVPNLTTGGNDDNVTNTPEPEDIDTIMDGLNSNSDDNLDGQNNGSYPSSVDSKQEIPDYSDIEDIKENDILNDLKDPLNPKTKKLGKKRSDNNKQPKIIKHELTTPLESNTNNEKGSPQNSIKPLRPNSKEILKVSNSVPNLTTGGNDDNVTNTPERDDIDTIMDGLNSNSDDNLDDQNNGSYPSSLDTKQEIPDYSDIEDIKENDILKDLKDPFNPKTKKLGKKRSDNNKQPKIIKHELTTPLESNTNNEKGSPQNSIKPLAPNSKEILKVSNSVPNLTTGGNDDNVTNTPEPEDIDTIMDGLNSNSDDNLDDQNNGSYPSSVDTKQEIPDYSDIEDIKENDILNDLKDPLNPKTKKLGKKRSDNNKQPKIIKHELTTPLESNTNNEKGSPQNSIKPLAPNSKEILKVSNSVPNLTTGGNDDNVTNTPEPEDIDTIMDGLNSNSDDNLEGQNNGSYPSSVDSKQEIPDYSDIEDIKENDILNDLKDPLNPKTKKLGKKRSDNNKQPKIIKHELTTPLESNTNNEKGSPQNSIKPLRPNSKEILKVSNSVPNLTTGGNDDNVTNTPERDDIDTIMDGLNSNSDDNLDDQNNGSYPSSLETKQEIPDYSDIEDIKENHILNDLKDPLNPKTKKLGKKRSDNNKQPKIIKHELTTPLESNTNNEKGSPQNSIKPLAPNSKEILKVSNSVPNLTTGGNDDNVTNTPEPEDIDTIMDGLNSNSDDNLDGQNNGSYPSSVDSKQEIPDYSDIEDIKENDILNDLKDPLNPKTKKLGKKRSDNNKQPKIIKHELTTPLESNTNNEKGSPQNSIKPLRPNSKEILKVSNSVPNLTTGGNDDNVTNTPERDDIDTIMDGLNSNSDDNLDDQNNGSYPSSLDTKQEIPDYSDIEDIKENDILKDLKDPFNPKTKKLGKKRSDNNKQPKIIKHELTTPLESNTNNEKGSPQNSIKPLAPNSKEILKVSNSVPNLTTGGNDDNVTNTPEPEDIDTIMDGLNSNSDDNLDDQNNGSYPSSVDTKQEIPDYSDIEDIKENDILNDLKDPLNPKTKKLGKKRSDNNKQPKIIKHELTTPLESNTNNEKGSPQNSIKPLAPNSKEILKVSNSVPNLTTGGNDDNVTNTPEPEDIDTIMDGLNSNSDDNLEGQNNGSYPSSVDSKQEIPDYSDIEDIKENDILNDLKDPLNPKTKKLGKKRSDNNKQPKIIKHELTTPLESNTNNEKGSPQNSIKPLRPNSKEILKVSNSVPNLTTGGNDDNVTNTPERDDIDTIMDGLNSNSDDNLDDQNNGSYPSSLDTKQEIPDYSDIEDIKENDILNDLKDPFNPKTKKLGKKRSDNNKQPKIIKHELTTPLESNTNNEKGSPQNSIKPLAPNSKEILKVSNSVPNLTTGGNDDNVTNTPEPEDIDTIMDGLNSNSDDNLDDQNNGSYPSSVDTKQEIPDYSDIEDIKENDILNDLKDPLNPKTKKLGKKRSDNNKQPKIIKHELTTPLESNTNNEKGSPQNSIKPLAPNSKEILKVSNSVPNLTTGGNDDNVTNTPEPEDIDTIMDGLNSNSDDNLDDQNNGSYPSSVDTKQEIPDYSDIEDIKENDILNDLKDPLNPKTKKLGKKRSDNNKQPKIIKHELTTPLESNTNNEKGSPQNSIKPLAPNSKEILKVSNSVPNLTTGGNDDNVTNTPERDDIDTIMDGLNSNSDDNLDDQNNGSYPSSLDTKQEIPDYSDTEDIKENDILNDLKDPLNPKTKKLGKKRSDNNKQPKIIKHELTTPLESNTNNEKGSPKNSIKPLAPNSKEILKVSNSVPNLITGGNDDNVTNTPEPDDIDTIMDGLNSNSDENLDDQNNGSYPSSLDTKQEIPDYSDTEDIKENDILNDLKDPINPKTKKLGKKRSDYNKQPKIIKHELTTPMESNNNNEKGSPQNSIKPLAPNSKEILKISNSVPNITTEGNNVTLMEKNDLSSPNLKHETTEFSIPKDNNSQIIREKNKSLEKLNPNSKTIIEKPHITEESISNKLDKPKIYRKPVTLDNPDKDIRILDISDEYNNLGGMTMEDSDFKTFVDKSPNIKDKQDKSITEKNKSSPNINCKTIKPETDDSIGTLNFSDEIPDDQLAFINDLSYEKTNEEKPSDQSINLVPTTDKIPDSEKILSTDEPPGKDWKIDDENILNKVPRPSLFESDTGKPMSNDDADNGKSNVIPVPSLSKDDEGNSKNSRGNQKVIDLDDKSVSSIEELLNSLKDEDDSQLTAIDFDDVNVTPMEKNDLSLQNLKHETTEFSTPNDNNSQIIREKNKSLEKLNPNSNTIIEKPHITEESISNKLDKPKIYRRPVILDNPDKDIKILDISDEYNNLGGMTMEDSDFKTSVDKLPNIKDKQDKSITEKNKSTPNINCKTIKPETDDSIGTLNFSDEIPDDQLAFINDLSYEKTNEEKPNDQSINLVPTTDKIPDSEKILSTDEPPGKDWKIDDENILNKVPQPSLFESDTGKPMSNDDADNGKSNVIPVPSLSKDDEGNSKNSPGNQKVIDLDDKSVSSIEELLKSLKDEDDSQLTSINFDDVNVTPMEKNDLSLPNLKHETTEFSIPNDNNSQIIREKNKSVEKLNPNSNTIIEKPHITEESISNKLDKPKIYRKPVTLDNPDKDIRILDISDEYNNLGGMTMEDSDFKTFVDKSPNIKDKQDKSITEKNKSSPNINCKTIKPETDDSIGTLNFSDEIPDDQLAFINDLSYEKTNEEKPSDQSINLVPTTDKIPDSEKILSTDEPPGKDWKIDDENILNKVPQPSLFESDTGKPMSNDDADNGKSNVIPVPSLSKDDEGNSKNSPGNQKVIDLDDKSVSSIEELLNSLKDEDDSQLTAIDFDDVNVTPMEKNDLSLPNLKHETTEFSTPNDNNSQIIREKNKSLEKLNPNSNTIIEKPNITEESISNKLDKPKIYRKPVTLDNPDKDIKILDISDEYNNLGGMTMEDSDFKTSVDKLPNIKDKQDKSITEKNKSTPNINCKTIKPETDDSIGTLNFSDEIPDDHLAFINDLSYEKTNEEKPSDQSINLVPTTDKIPNSEKILSTDGPPGKDWKMDGENILNKVPQPSLFASDTGKPISNDDADNGKINVIPVTCLSKDDEGNSKNSPGNQKVIDLDDKSVSSIEELLKSLKDEDDSQLTSINFDDVNVTPMEKNDLSLQNLKHETTEFSTPNDNNSQIIREKNKSLEKLNPNSNTIIEKPHITEESISNKLDKPKIYRKPVTLDNPDKDIKIFDISDEYNNLGGMTMEDSDFKTSVDKSPNIKDKQDKSIMEKNKSTPNINCKTIKPETDDSIGTLNFSDEIPDDQLAFINDLSYEKSNEEKQSDQSINLVPTTDKIPDSEKILSTDEPPGKDWKMDGENILNKVPQPSLFESDTGKPMSNDDADNGKSNVIPVPSLSKDDEGNSKNSPGNLKVIDLDDKSVSSIEELLKSPKDEDDSQLTSINFDDVNVTPMEKNDLSLSNLKNETTEFSIPNDNNSQIIREKNKCLEKLNPNSNTIIEKPHITEESISNKLDKPKIYRKPVTLDNPDKDIRILDISDEYNNLGGMTMEDSDFKTSVDKSPNIKDKQDKSIMEKNKSTPNINCKTIKPETDDSIGTLNFSDEIPDDQLAFINDLSYEKTNEKKPSDQSINLVPKTDKIPNSEKILSTDGPLGKDWKMDGDNILNKVPQPSLFASDTGKPMSNDDADNGKSNVIPVPSLSKDDEGNSKNSPGNLKVIDLDDKSVSSIEELLKSPKDEDNSQLTPNSNTIIEKPHITEESISNKLDKPKIYRKPVTLDNPDKDIKIFDISDEYNNLGGMTMEDSDFKTSVDKSPKIKDKQDKSITEKNKSSPNINCKTIKPETDDSIGTLNFSDEIPDDQLAFINDLSYEKSNEEKPSDQSINLVPTTDKIPNSEKILSTDEMDGENILNKVPQPSLFESDTGKPMSNDDADNGKSNVIPVPSLSEDDEGNSKNSPGNQKVIDLDDKSVSSIEELLKSPKDEDNSQLTPNSNTIIEKPHITEESISNKLDKPKIYRKPVTLDNPDKDIKILDISDEYNNLGGMTMEDSDFKTFVDKSPNIKDKQDKSITEKNKLSPNINCKTIKPETDDSIGTLNFSDIKPEDEFASNNDLSYKKANEEKPSDKSIDLVLMTDKLPNSEKDLYFDKNSELDGDSILHKVIQSNPFELETGKPTSDDDAVNVKSNVISIPSILKDDEISDVNKTEVKLPNKIIIQNKTGNIKVPSTNVHDKFFPGNSEYEVNFSNSGQYGVKPNSPNSKISNPDKHILITNKDEHSSVVNEVYKHNNSFLDDDEAINFNPGRETKFIMDNSKYLSENHNQNIPVNRFKQENNEFWRTAPNIEHTMNKTPIMSDYNLLNEDDNPYGYMLPKFSTKYIEGGDSNNLWEKVPPKKNNDFSIHKESDHYNNDINQSVGYTMKNIISSHINNDKKIMSETKTVKNTYDDKGNTDKMYEDIIQKMSEQLKKINNIDDKISKLDLLSNNSSYITQSYNLTSDDPGTKKIILMNDLPISKPKNNIEELDSELDSKRKKSVESHETMISYKSNDENVIKESTKPKKDKHKKHKRRNKKHKKHSKHDRHKKKKKKKKNDKNDSYDDGEDDNNDDVDGSHTKYKIHKKNDKKDEDDKHKKNKSRKKNEMIDSDVDVDDDYDDDRVKKKSHKKNYINDADVEVSRNKKNINKTKRKIIENISPHETNEVNNSSSLQMSNEDDDSVKGLKIKSKSKNSKKTNLTKSKNSSPKKKSKHMKHSKFIKYKNKEIPVDVSDEDSSRNNNQNNVPNEITHKHKKRKHKKHKKPLKTSKTYNFKESPVDNEDKISDENNVNLEETYNINITNDGTALKQKRLRHKRLKKMKNIDINILKDTDNQVLNRDTNTRHGYLFYTIYPQYRNINPLARLFY